ncbi:MAG: hypothetical protein K6T73_09205, partial [Candidatus Bathyarchaeota archaeon]|nr:hypothetical protein [Candidatus Bathyarchaeota archaeon]
MFKKKLMLTIGLISIMLLTTQQSVFSSQPQPVFDPYELVIDTILGDGPKTLDPANCYDTASAGLLFNVYETLILFDGERYDYFISQLAEQV